MLVLKSLGLVVGLAGCVPTVSGTAYYDGRFWYLNAKSATDIGGGPRQDVLLVVDRDGRVVNQFQAAGPGTLQGMAQSLGPAALTAAGQAAAGALQRPSRNTTDVEMNVQGTGGSGGSATGGAATGGGASASAGDR